MNYKTRLIVWIIADSLVIAASVFLSYLVRFEFQLDTSYLHDMPYVAILHIMLVVSALYLGKMYRPIIRFVSMVEMIAVFKAVTAAELLLYATNELVHWSTGHNIVPRSIFILSWAFVLLGVGGLRMGGKLMAEPLRKKRPHERRTLIVGAGSAGLLVAKELLHNQSGEQFPVAFIDDDENKQNMQIIGLPVVGGRADIPKVVEELLILDIVIAIPSCSSREIAGIIDICKRTKATVKILPRVADVINGQVTAKKIRDVNIEDLLGREAVQIDLREVAHCLNGKVILVTGAGGSIGSEICRQVAQFQPRELLLLGHGENSIYEIEMELKRSNPSFAVQSIIADIQDMNRLQEVFLQHRPSVVFHAAAHKHVPLMEVNPAEAIKNNVLGTRNVAYCAHEFESDRFVLISTDKAVNPASIMGASKRIAELIISGMDKVSRTTFVAVRFGNVLGSRGSVIPLFLKQIKQGGPVTVTHPDMVRYFMTIPEAVQLVLQAATLACGGEVFLLDMGEPVKIVDIAKNLIRLAGFQPETEIGVVYTGIRQGEKLFEELLTTEEGASCTRHDRIFVGKQCEVSWSELQLALSHLESLVSSKRTDWLHEEIREIIKSIVPEFQYEAKRDLVVDPTVARGR